MVDGTLMFRVDRRAALDKLRTIVLTAATITGVALLFAVPSVMPAASATVGATGAMIQAVSEEARQTVSPPIDTGRLVKWDFKVAPSVSVEPIRESVITKIAAGRVTTVHVVETTTGIYSSDAMEDPHVLYPGIERTRAKTDGGDILVLDNRRWISAIPVAANSFVSVLPYEGGRLIVRDGVACTVTRTLSTC
jgi:hypothetical protein